MRHGQNQREVSCAWWCKAQRLEFEVEVGRSTLGLFRSSVPRIRFGLYNLEFCFYLCWTRTVVPHIGLLLKEASGSYRGLRRDMKLDVKHSGDPIRGPH